jgi:H+/Cl- antiporter ClcA
VGTWGPGAFDNDDALDLLGTLAEQDAASRRQTLEQIFRRAREHPEDLNWTLSPGQVVAAAAVVAAGLPAGSELPCR